MTVRRVVGGALLCGAAFMRVGDASAASAPVATPAADSTAAMTPSQQKQGLLLDEEGSFAEEHRGGAVRDYHPRKANNLVYLEALGPGLFYSVNYERMFDNLSARVGIGYFSHIESEERVSFLTIPITASYLGIRSNQHIFEMGAGATVVHATAGASTFVETGTSSLTTLLPTVLAGYRYQLDPGFVLKVGGSAMFNRSKVLPWPYLAAGGTF